MLHILQRPFGTVYVEPNCVLDAAAMCGTLTMAFSLGECNRVANEGKISVG